MVNTTAKGNRTIAKFRKSFKREFDFFQKVEDSSPFAATRDLFGLFDFVGLKGNEYFLLQFKTNKFDTDKKFKNFVKKHGNPYIRVQQWMWEDRKGWIVKEYYQDGFVEKYDLRGKKDKELKEAVMIEVI